MAWLLPWLALTGAGAAWSGWALTILWSWFVVPTFRAPALSVPAAIGIALLVRMFGASSSATNDEKKTQSDRFAYAAAWMIMQPAFALGFGWLVHLFMGTS